MSGEYKGLIAFILVVVLFVGGLITLACIANEDNWNKNDGAGKCYTHQHIDRRLFGGGHETLTTYCKVVNK